MFTLLFYPFLQSVAHMTIPYLKQRWNQHLHNRTGGPPARQASQPETSAGQRHEASKARALVVSLVLMAGILTMVPATTEAAAVCNGKNGTENFNDYALFFRPNNGVATCLYSNAATTGIVVADPVNSANKVWDNEGSLSSALNVFNDPCDPAVNPSKATITYGLRFRWPAISAGASTDLLIVGSPLMGIAFRGDLGMTGATMGVHTKGPSGGSQLYTAFPGAPVPLADTWYRASLSISDTDNSAVCGDVTSTVTAIITSDTGTVLGGRTQALRGGSGLPVDNGFVGFNGVLLQTGAQTVFGRQVFIDDISVSGFSTALTPTVAIGVTGLSGFDVDSSGSVAIARSSDASGGTEDNVRTYDAATLANLGGPLNTQCLRTQGVTAQRSNSGEDYVSFFQCDSGNALLVDSLSIRSRSLGSPDRPSFCTGPFLNFCVTDIADSELAGDSDQHYDYVATEAFPMDYSITGDGFTSEDWVAMAFGVSTTAGEIGVVSYVMNNDADDKSQIALQNIAGVGNPVDQICTVRDSSNGASYLYGADSQAQVKGYKIVFDLDDPVGSETQLSIDLDLVFAGTAATSSPRGVGCGEGKLVILNDDKLTIWNRTSAGQSPSPYVTIGNCGAISISCVPMSFSTVPELAGVAMSGNGKWIAFVINGVIYFATTINRASCGDATNTISPCPQGTIVGTAALPSGVFKKIDLKGTGTTAWAATQTNIAVYGDLFTVTSGTDEACNPGQVGCGPISDDNDDGGETPGDGSGSIGNAFFGSAYMVVFMLAGVLCLVVLCVGALTGRHSGTAYGLAVLAAYFIGIFMYGTDEVSPWPLAVLGALTVAIVFVKVKSSG